MSIFMLSFFSAFILTALFNVGYLKTLKRLEEIHSDWWPRLKNPFERAFGKKYRKDMLSFLLWAPSSDDGEVRAFGVKVRRFMKPYIVTAAIASGGACLCVFAALAAGVAQVVNGLCADGMTHGKWLNLVYCLFAVAWIDLLFSFARRMRRISRLFASAGRIERKRRREIR